DEVIVTTDGAYFSSRNGVVFWDFTRKECDLYELPRLAKIFAVGNRIFVSAFDQPLRYLDVKERALRASPVTLLDQMPVDRALPLDDARALISFFDGRLFVFDGQQVWPWSGQDAGVKGRLSALRRLVDGNIAAAINGKGVFILSPE